MNASKLITGMEKKDEPTLPPRGDNRHYLPGSVLGNRFYIGDKPFGMEPGMLVLTINEELIDRLIDHQIIGPNKKFWEGLDEEKRILFLTTQINALYEPYLTHIESSQILKNELPEKEYFQQLVNLLDSDVAPNENAIKLKKLILFTRELIKEGMSGKIPLDLIKQDYTDSSTSPPEDRLRKTTRGESLSKLGIYIWKRGKQIFSSRKKENANALGEAFANAVARAYAMPAQNQHVIFGAYTNGDLKIMTDCEWMTGLESMTGKVAGEKYQGYYVVNGGESAIDQLRCAGQNLSLMLIQGDDDGFGSKLQNKMIYKNELYGIDFGHAYRGKNNPLIDQLSVDFTLKDDVLKKFKNFSILFDTPPTDQMLGIFYTYKTMDQETKLKIFGEAGVNAVDKAIESYKEYYKETYPEFSKKIDSIQPGCVLKIKNDYVDALKDKISALLSQAKLLNSEMANESDPVKKSQLKQEIAKLIKVSLELQSNIEILENKYKLHQDSSSKLLTKFKDRLCLSPEELLLVRNLASLTSTTRQTDRSGSVVLKHLQIEHDKQRIEWNMTTSTDDVITISANVNSSKAAMIAKKLDAYFAAHPTGSDAVKYEAKNGINITLPRAALAGLMEACHEGNIIKFKTQAAAQNKAKSNVILKEDATSSKVRLGALKRRLGLFSRVGRSDQKKEVDISLVSTKKPN